MGLHRFIELGVGVVLHQGNRFDGFVDAILDFAGKACQTRLESLGITGVGVQAASAMPPPMNGVQECSEINR